MCGDGTELGRHLHLGVGRWPPLEAARRWSGTPCRIAGPSGSPSAVPQPQLLRRGSRAHSRCSSRCAHSCPSTLSPQAVERLALNRCWPSLLFVWGCSGWGAQEYESGIKSFGEFWTAEDFLGIYCHIKRASELPHAVDIRFGRQRGCQRTTPTVAVPCVAC